MYFTQLGKRGKKKRHYSNKSGEIKWKFISHSVYRYLSGISTILNILEANIKIDPRFTIYIQTPIRQ